MKFNLGEERLNGETLTWNTKQSKWGGGRGGFGLGVDRVVDHVVVEEGFRTVAPGEGFTTDVVVLVEGAFGRLVVVFMVLVHHVIIVVLFNTVDVDTQYYR